MLTAVAAAICLSTAVHVDVRATMNADWLPDEAPVRLIGVCLLTRPGMAHVAAAASYSRK